MIMGSFDRSCRELATIMNGYGRAGRTNGTWTQTAAPSSCPPRAGPNEPAAAQSQPLRQTAQPALWSEATIRQPAGASGHPAWAGFPVGHPASTTVVPGGSGW